MKARFDLDDTRFYTLAMQDLERYLSEIIAPASKAEFLSMIKSTVHFILSVGYVPSDAFLPACDNKGQGLLRLI